MPLSFTCPHCQTSTLVADQYVGQTGPCSNCQQTVTIADPGMMQPQFVATGSGDGMGDSAGMRLLLPVGRSIWAILAGYFGLFAVLIFPAPLALLFGILAVRDIRRNRELHGMGRAIFGIVMGVIGSGFLVLLIVALLAGR